MNKKFDTTVRSGRDQYMLVILAKNFPLFGNPHRNRLDDADGAATSN